MEEQAPGESNNVILGTTSIEAIGDEREDENISCCGLVSKAQGTFVEDLPRMAGS